MKCKKISICTYCLKAEPAVSSPPFVQLTLYCVIVRTFYKIMPSI